MHSASRLGLDACLATKVGSDANGRLILHGLEEEGVDVSRVVVSDATPSAFTYVIVDKEGGTRTCLHTPQTEGAGLLRFVCFVLFCFYLPRDVFVRILPRVVTAVVAPLHHHYFVFLSRPEKEGGGGEKNVLSVQFAFLSLCQPLLVRCSFPLLLTSVRSTGVHNRIMYTISLLHSETLL